MKTLIKTIKKYPLKHDLQTIIKFLKLNFKITYKTCYKKGNFIHNIIELQPLNFRYPYLTFVSLNNMVRYIENFSMAEVMG